MVADQGCGHLGISFAQLTSFDLARNNVIWRSLIRRHSVLPTRIAFGGVPVHNVIMYKRHFGIPKCFWRRHGEIISFGRPSLDVIGAGEGT